MSLAKMEINITPQIAKLVDDELTKVMEKEFDEMVQKLNDRKRELVARILLNVQKTIDIQQISDRTIFTIREVKA